MTFPKEVPLGLGYHGSILMVAALVTDFQRYPHLFVVHCFRLCSRHHTACGPGQTPGQRAGVMPPINKKLEPKKSRVIARIEVTTEGRSIASP